MQRPILHGLIAVSCLGLGAAGALWIVNGRPQPPEADLPSPRAVSVDWTTLSAGEVPRRVAGTGTLRAARQARLALEYGGRIASVWPELADGIAVSGGTELLSLDVGSLNLEIQAQQTTVELAEIQGRGALSDLEHAAAAVTIAGERLQLLKDEEARWKTLAAEGRAERARVDLATQARLTASLGLEEAKRAEESARTRIESAKKEVRLAQDRVAVLEDRRQRSVLRAPFDGRFSLSTAGPAPRRTVPEPGDVLAPLEPVGVLLDAATMTLTCEVHENDVGLLFVGAPAVVAPHSQPGRLLSGRVSAVGAQVESALRAVPVELTLEGTAEKPLALPAGSFATVEIHARPARNALFVEDGWIAYRSGRAVVFVIEAPDGSEAPIARARPITFLDGIHSGGRIVTSGLSAGDRVITGSLELIGDGTELILR